MLYKIITLKKLENILGQITQHRIGPAKRIDSPEIFFLFELIVDEEFFNIPVLFNRNIILGFPLGIHYRFQLIGMGNIDNQRAFSFKPTCLSEDNDNIKNQLEDFILMIPDYIFFAIIEMCVTNNYFEYEDLFDLNILDELDEDEFYKFGITLTETEVGFETSRLSVNRILHGLEFDPFKSFKNLKTTTPEDIFEFCNDNDFKIDEGEASEYFDEDSNLWYSAKKKGTNFQIGYVRLSMDKYHFPNSLIIQVIVAKKHRGISVGDELINGFRWFLAKNSNLLNLVALVPSNYYFLKKTLDINEFVLKERNMLNGYDYYEYEVMRKTDNKILQNCNSGTAYISFN